MISDLELLTSSLEELKKIRGMGIPEIIDEILESVR